MILSKLSQAEAIYRTNKLGFIQNSFAINLPPLYIDFITTYAVGQYTEHWDSSIDKFLRMNPVSEVYYEKGDLKVSYGWLYSPDEFYQDFISYSERKLLLEQFGVVRIGNIVSGGGFFLGVSKQNAEIIYKMNWDIDDQPIQIADSIFDFVNYLRVEFICSGLVKTIGQIFYHDPKVNFQIKGTVLADIEASQYIESPSISDNELLLRLEKEFSNVRNKNFNGGS